MSRAKGIDTQYTNVLRRAAKLTCPLDNCGAEVDPVDSTIKEHIKDAHADILGTRDPAALVPEFRR